MHNQLADVCDRCGRVAVKKQQGESSEMVVLLQETSTTLIYLGDILPGESTRPTFRLDGKAFCPDCYLAEITEWVGKFNARPGKGGE